VKNSGGERGRKSERGRVKRSGDKGRKCHDLVRNTPGRVVLDFVFRSPSGGNLLKV